MEDDFLGATVRFVVESWRLKPGEKGYTIASAVGHGTVMDGRFLVTHNHLGIPLGLLFPGGEDAGYSRILIYDAPGRLLYNGPLAQVSVSAVGAQMLILDFKDQDGKPFFEALGFASANFLNSADITLRPGMEVGQLDWDGARSRIDWTTVEIVQLAGNAPHLHLVDPIMTGASGGGVFCNGYHVANNWTTLAYYDGDDNLIGRHSTAALNTAGGGSG